MSDEKIYNFTKATLEALRNTAIVATFGYISAINPSLYLYILYQVGSLALVFNVAHQIPVLNLNIDSFKRDRINRASEIFISVVARLIPGVILVVILSHAVKDIARIQTEQSASKSAMHVPEQCRFTLDRTGYRCL